VILASGAINGDERSSLMALVQALPQTSVPHTLVISSEGGSMVSAIHLGLSLRQLGLRTAVGALAQGRDGRMSIRAGKCFSACVLVFMGGTDRTVAPGSRIGVHSPQVLIVSGGREYLPDGPSRRYIVDATSSLLRSYAEEMGVRPALITVAHAVPYTGIRVLSRSELLTYRLVTNQAPFPPVEFRSHQ
jgi:hypothetical protein